MTQLFDDTGRAVGVTAVEIWDAKVIRLREEAKDGYIAMQLGAGPSKGQGKAVDGQSGGTAYAILKEFPNPDGLAVGATLGLDQLEIDERVAVSAISKGKGFQGTVKRHNFSRGPKSHGSRNYRAPGSVGGTGAARVFPGQKMPGRMGNERITEKNLRVADIHPQEKVILLAGAVPGTVGSFVTITSLAKPAAPAANKDATEAEPTAEPQKEKATS